MNEPKQCPICRQKPSDRSCLPWRWIGYHLKWEHDCLLIEAGNCKAQCPGCYQLFDEPEDFAEHLEAGCYRQWLTLKQLEKIECP